MNLRGFETYRSNGLPVTGATVEVYEANTVHPPGTTVITSGTTDSNGMWAFTGLSETPKDIKVTFGASEVRWYKGLTRHSVDGMLVNGILRVNGTLTIPTGAGAGKVLTSDANGVASWTTTLGVDAVPTHDIISKHSASGLTASHVLRATSATGFAFGTVDTAGVTDNAINTAKLAANAVSQMGMSTSTADAEYAGDTFAAIGGDGTSSETAVTFTTGTSTLGIAVFYLGGFQIKEAAGARFQLQAQIKLGAGAFGTPRSSFRPISHAAAEYVALGLFTIYTGLTASSSYTVRIEWISTDSVGGNRTVKVSTGTLVAIELRR